jgi:DNA-binding SARP family transcriptional activator
VTPTGQILPSSELVFAFALYLCVRAGEHVPRAELIELFWPHADEAKGRHNLRQMLYRLKEIGITLDETGELLSLSPVRVRCDLADALRSDWIIEADEATIAAACDALPGLTRRFSERYGEWIDEIRARLESQFRRAALRVLSDAKTEGRWYDVEHWALMLLRTDPLNETAVLARAEGTAMLGSKAEAIEQLDRYLGELGPKAEQIGLPAKVLRRRIKEQGERKAGEHGLPLVGREDEIRRLTEALHGCRESHGRVTILYGAAGIGKTRLAIEVLDIAHLLGFTHFSITPYAQPNGQSAFALAESLARSLVELPGAIGISPDALGIAKRVIRVQEQETFATPDLVSGQLDLNALEWSLTELLRVTSAEKPLSIHVDDVHDLSVEAKNLLGALTGSTSHSRIHWLLSGRDNSGLEHKLTSTRHIRLSGLDHNACLALARAARGLSETENNSDLVNLLARRSGGNPFYLLAISDSNDSTRIPGHVRQALIDRITSLSPAEVDILELVYFLGPMASVHRLAAISDLQVKELARNLETLDSFHGVFTNTPPGTLRLHDIWSETLSERIGARASALRALQVAHFLESEAVFHSDTSLAWQGHLFEQAGQFDKAVEKHQLAGDAVNSRGLPLEALTHYWNAQNAQKDRESSLALGCRIVAALLRTHKTEEALTSSSTFIKQHFSSGRSDASALVLIHALRADASFRLNLPFSEDLCTIIQLLDSGLVGDHDSGVALLIAMRLSLTAPDKLHSESLFAATLSQPKSAHTSLPVLLAQLIFSAEHRDASSIEQIAIKTEQAAFLYPMPEWRGTATRYLAMTYRWLGNLDRSEALAERGSQFAREMGFIDEAFSLAIQTCNLHLDHGNSGKAHFWLSQALSIPAELVTPERKRALLFTKARCSLLEGDHAAVLRAYESAAVSPVEDPLWRRAIMDSACIGLAHLGLNQTESARREASFIAKQLTAIHINQQLDFAIDAAEGIASKLSLTDVSSVLRSLVQRRQHFRVRHIPSSFTYLQNLFAA